MIEPWMIKEMGSFYEEEMESPLDKETEKKINDIFDRWLCGCRATNE